MFFQLLFIHLFRPFLKYKQANSPLPAHVSPRKFLIHSATTISKLLRLYRRTYGLRQICNIVVYIAHTACTVHLLNLPDKNASRDIAHGLNHLEEIAEGWLCARRTLRILYLVTRRWNIELPEAATKTFMRTEAKFGSIRIPDHDAEHRADDDFLTRPSPTQALPRRRTPPDSHGVSRQTVEQSTPPFLPASGPLSRPTPAPESAYFDPSLDLPPGRQPDFSRPPAQMQYAAAASQPEQWNTSLYDGNPSNGALPASSAAQPAVTSPTTMFGGVQGLMQDHEWWLRESNQFFATWNHGIDGSRVGGQGMVGGPGNFVDGHGNGNGSANESGSLADMNGGNGFGLMDGRY